MEKQIVDNPDISNFERLLDENWNERKQLAETEFDLRSGIQDLLQRAVTGEKLKEALARERDCRASLARNNTDYDALIAGWAATIPPVTV